MSEKAGTKKAQEHLLSLLCDAQVITQAQAQAHPISESAASIIPDIARLVGNDDALVSAVATAFGRPAFKDIEEGRKIVFGSASEPFCFYDGILFLTNPLDSDAANAALAWARRKLQDSEISYIGTPNIGVIGASKLDSLRGVDSVTEDVSDAAKAQARASIETMLKDAAHMRASDIHLQPVRGGSVRVRYRIDGRLRTIKSYPLNLHPSLCRVVLEGLCGLNLDTNIPLDGKFEFDNSSSKISVRVSSCPVVIGSANSLKLVLRLLGGEKKHSDLSKLNIALGNLEILRRLSNEPHGFIALTGPTGSGKTNTLGAMGEEAQRNNPDLNYHSIEDPVEVQREGWTHTEVGGKVTFATALRALLRQDPDVMIVGEVRDPETAELAFQAALTGHLLLTSLHAINAHDAVVRLLGLDVPLDIIVSNTSALAAQRLVRLLCPSCKVRHRLKDDQKSGVYSGHAVFAENPNQLVYSANPTGCSQCGANSGGYKGRTLVLEVLEFTNQVKDYLASGMSPMHLRRTMIANGTFKDMWHDGLRLVAEGLTDLREIEGALGALQTDTLSGTNRRSDIDRPQGGHHLTGVGSGEPVRL